VLARANPLPLPLPQPRVLHTPRQEREAAQRAAELASRALAAEKRLVEAMKEEAAASTELLEAERAAKAAAQVRALVCVCVCVCVGWRAHTSSRVAWCVARRRPCQPAHQPRCLGCV
jgi:hypothetical protein